MAKKKEVYKVKPLNENKKNIIAALIDEYDIETADDIQEALKDLLGGTIKSMMEAEMDEHLGYERYERNDGDNYHNGTKSKKVRSSYGEFEIDVPQDRFGTFEPKIVKKRQDEAETKLIAMLPEGGVKIFEEFMEAAGHVEALEQEEIYSQGFYFGLQLTTEAYTKNKNSVAKCIFE